MILTSADIKPQVTSLLQEVGPGKMTNTAYDTAWIVRLADLDPELSFQALDWLADNQASDGSWGTSEIFYYHDRVISTLAAIIALARYGRRNRDRLRWKKGLEALENMTRATTKGLMADISGATAGFELIVPTLLAEAESLGIMRSNGERGLGRLNSERAIKLGMLHGRMISRQLTMAYSAEMAGPDAKHLLNLEDLQEANGSVANSPSATAYYALHIRPGDPKALEYLHRINLNRGFTNVAPFDMYERAWVLWNLALVDTLDDDLKTLCTPHIDFLCAGWRPGLGVGFSVECALRESDDTSVSYEVLNRFGRSADLDTVLTYEQTDHFRCYDLETSPSTSANVHVLSALRQSGMDIKHPTVQKVLGFLRRTRKPAAFWADKWHASPYYTTAHAIIASAGYCEDLVNESVDWILETQNLDGSWGYYMPSAEETAYCLQALVVWQRAGHNVGPEVIERGGAWLVEHQDDPNPAMWIAKSLNSPTLIVRSAILSALMMIA